MAIFTQGSSRDYSPEALLRRLELLESDAKRIAEHARTLSRFAGLPQPQARLLINAYMQVRHARLQLEHLSGKAELNTTNVLNLPQTGPK